MKMLLKRALRRLGLDLNRYPHPHLAAGVVKRVLTDHAVTAVVDIGANVGQFAGELIEHGFRGRILSFEPLSEAHARLARTAAGHPQWTVAPRCALGAAASELEINISENSFSSSLLGMEARHAAAAPASRYVRSERVTVRRLDDALHEQPGLLPGRLMIKIDTQGYEDRVIMGAPEALRSARVLMVELSLAPLYAGQRLMPEMLALLEERGFRLVNLFPAFQAPADGRLLQVDGLFIAGGASAAASASGHDKGSPA